MTIQVVDIKCPGCQEPVNTGYNECPYCGRPVIINSFNSVNLMQLPEIGKYANTYKQVLITDPDNKAINNAAAFCFLKLKLYDKALEFFDKAIIDNFDNSETYFYAAVCLLKGGKPFLISRPVIDKIIEYIQAAIAIEPKAIYYYFFAYIKYDFFFRKSYLTTPTYKDLLSQAQNLGVSKFDIDQLFEILCVPRPENI